jgi:hypothetical protein
VSSAAARAESDKRRWSRGTATTRQRSGHSPGALLVLVVVAVPIREWFDTMSGQAGATLMLADLGCGLLVIVLGPVSARAAQCGP